MSKSKKKLVLTITIVALAALLAVGATLAFLTDNKTITNFLGIGRDKDNNKLIGITLTEPKFVAKIESDASLGSVVKDTDGNVTEAKLYKIMPGDNIPKDPTIKVTGAKPVYLRMKVEGNDGTDALLPNTLLTKADPDGLGLAAGDDWAKVGDWYYYIVGGSTNIAGNPTGTSVVNGSTVPVFKMNASGVSMKVPTSWDYAQIDALVAAVGGTANNPLELKVTVQAVQSDNFTPNLAATDPWTGVTAPATITIPPSAG